MVPIRLYAAAAGGLTGILLWPFKALYRLANTKA